MERERLGSLLGFILLSAGCAIGVGNVWKFLYMTGQKWRLHGYMAVVANCLLMMFYTSVTV